MNPAAFARSTSAWASAGSLCLATSVVVPTTIVGPPASAAGASESAATPATTPLSTPVRTMDTATLATRSEETVGTAPEGAPDQAGRLHLQGRQGPGPLRGQGEVAPPARPVVLPGEPGRPRGDPAAPRAGRGHRGGRHGQRGRGPSPRAEPRQAAPAALQRAAAGRQVVPVHRGHRRGRVPARDVHARAASSRRRLFRAVCECQKGTRHAGRPEPRVPVPALRGAEAGASLGYPLPRLPHRALPCAVRRTTSRRTPTARSSTG